MDKSNAGKRIAINTFLLYFRSIIVMLISIYSSRILLQTLGVEDFGLYNIVGAVVAMFSSIKSVLASAVQRFLNFERGRGNEFNCCKIFNMSVTIHIGISLLFGFLVELFGYWYITNQLVLPANNVSTALFVFHCSVIATMITIYTIPYDAVVIANEKMNFYAAQSILDVSLKLLIIFLLPLLPFEYIRSYAVLILVIAIIIRLSSLAYTRKFPECRRCNSWDKQTFRELTTFAGWNFLGCVSYSLVEEGANLILNAFGGVVANAARGLSYQVRGAVMTLSNNILVASQPHITQSGASVGYHRFWEMIFVQSRIMFYIMLLTGLPLYVMVDDLLLLWLNEIPLYTAQFIKAIILYAVVMSFQKPLDLSFKTYNKMSVYQVVDTLILLLTLPLVYIVLHFGYPLYYAFLVFSLVRMIDYVAVLFVARRLLYLDVILYFKKVILPCSKAMVLFFLCSRFYELVNFQYGGLFLFIVKLFILLSLCFLFLYVFAFTSDDKKFFKGVVSKISLFK